MNKFHINYPHYTFEKATDAAKTDTSGNVVTTAPKGSTLIRRYSDADTYEVEDGDDKRVEELKRNLIEVVV